MQHLLGSGKVLWQSDEVEGDRPASVVDAEGQR